MSKKEELIHSESPRVSSLGSRLLSLVNGRRLKPLWWCLAALLIVAACFYIEIQTSLLQSWVFTRVNDRLFYILEDGPSREIAFPRPGPFDERRGYSKLPAFQARLESESFSVNRQVRQSETMMELLDHGISPPYPERPDTGLEVRGADDEPLFHYAQADFLFRKIGDIPPLLVKTLLFLENRDLDQPATSRQNPVIEWDRTFKAALFYVGSKLLLPLPVQGGSTLGVQLEKFHHSPHGRTEDPMEKLRQVVGASLKAYQAGSNTLAWRERIIIDYLNTMPLAAAPAYGEIHGLGEGLYAWFGMRLVDVIKDLNEPGNSPAKLRAFKHALTLLISVRAPSVFLVTERASLEEKVGQFIRIMANAGIIDRTFAAELQETPIKFLHSAPLPPQPYSSDNKVANAIRVSLMDLLGVNNLYDLNRLHLQVDSTIDVPLQKKVSEFFGRLDQPEVIKGYGLNGERLLQSDDPTKLIYSLLLIESTPNGNLVRVQADNLEAALDINKGVKLELGSTAKLRTLTHYLELMAELHKELSGMDPQQLKQRSNEARDPLTRWAAETLRAEKGLALQPFLDKAMQRHYSGNPYEAFFTGGGLHHFENFDKNENNHIFEVREGFRKSNNMTFIRLMRDLVSYHRARLPYDVNDIMDNIHSSVRRQMLQEIGEEESRTALYRAFQNYSKLTPEEIVSRVLGKKVSIERRLTILFFAWQIGTDEEALSAWLALHGAKTTESDIARLFRSYHNPNLTLADYAYLLGLHPLDLWGAGELRKEPGLSWEKLYAGSAEARRIGSSWLLHSRNRHAQDLRLRIRIEKDAFARMVPYWQRLGFPFKSLVPSYATAIGSSSDRPFALAELVGILINDGMHLPSTNLTKIQFARGTPYETLLRREPAKGEQVLAPEVARTVRKAMAEVVEQGTARRLHGVFKLGDGTVIPVGGKTGSGDNRFQTFSRTGAVTSSRATNRTATFVFYLGERYYGVITAYVQGGEAHNYHFTSALPVTLLKILAPTLIAKLDNKRDNPFAPLLGETSAD